MTSNQIQFAYNQEVERHNRKTEDLEKEQQRIEEEANKQQKRYQTAQVLLGVSNELNKAGNVANQAMANQTNATKAYVEAQNLYANRKLQQRQLDINERMNTESIRHMHEQDRLALRDVENKEYLSTLQARMNEANISHMLFEQNRELQEGYLKQGQFQLAVRAQEAVEFKNYIEASQTLFNGQRLLMDQQYQKYKIPVDIVNAQANVIRAISSKLLQ